MQEVELFDAVRTYFESLGYKVNGEIQDADVVAIREDTVIIIELKLRLNLDVILQAIERQKLTPMVYIAIKRQENVMKRRRFKRLIHLLQRLELGLLVCHQIHEEWFVEELLTPQSYTFKETTKIKKQRKQLLDEFQQRHTTERGGNTRKPIMTAYREEAIRIATYLDQYGALKIRELKALGCHARTGNILRDNYYGWFNRVSRGVYELTDLGKESLADYPKLVSLFRQALSEQTSADSQLKE